jgi:hypothetical protein
MSSNIALLRVMSLSNSARSGPRRAGGVAVAGQFVAAGDNAAHHRRIALGDPAEREERPLRAALFEDRQDALDVGFDAAFARRPAVAGDVGAKAETWK